MKILLTGGAGFIGRHVLTELIAHDHDIRVLDSLRADVHHGRPWSPPDGVELMHDDVRDPAAVDRALAGIDAVIHLAAKVGLGVDISDTPDYVSSNDYGTAELLAGMARRNVGHVTLASSMVVYGEGVGLCPVHGPVAPGPRTADAMSAGQFEPPCPTCGAPLAPALVGENAALDPRNVYASTKAAQELFVGNWARVTGGSASMMRYHNVYGPGMPRDTPYAGVAAIFLSSLRRGETPMVFEDGGQRRDFVHVRDIARATVRATEREATGTRAFNVGSGTVRTVGDMARSLARALDGSAPIVTGKFRLADVRHITADSSRIRDELGMTQMEDFDAGMRELALGASSTL